MGAEQIPLFSLLTQKMSWLSARQSVLAQNVANANTPGYIARDVQAPNFEQMMQGAHGPTSLSTTNALHMTAPTSGASGFQQIDSTDGEGSPSGNSVSLEKEVEKLSDTEIQYQAATNLYRKAVNLFQIALNGRS